MAAAHLDEIEREAQRIRVALFELPFEHPPLDAATSPCQHVGPDGQRCPRTATAFPCFCDEHGPDAYGVDVRPSLIPGAGMGLFATSDFDEGDTIDLYCGKVYPLGQEPADSAYLFNVDGHYALDARATQACLGRYLNHGQGDGANCIYRKFTPPGLKHTHVAVVALGPIRKGAELLVDYGPAYGRALEAKKKSKLN